MIPIPAAPSPSGQRGQTRASTPLYADRATTSSQTIPAPSSARLPGPASSTHPGPPAEQSHPSRQSLAHRLCFTNWHLPSPSRHRNLFRTGGLGGDRTATSQTLQPPSTSPLSCLGRDPPSPAEAGQQPGPMSWCPASLELSNPEVMGPLVGGTHRETGRQEMEPRGNAQGTRLGPDTDSLGRRVEESSRYISQPTSQRCRKCNYFWKSPVGRGACGRQNHAPKMSTSQSLEADYVRSHGKGNSGCRWN